MGAKADFETRVSRAIRRATVYDADIAGYVDDAVRDMENLHNWTHMWRMDEAKTLLKAGLTITIPKTAPSELGTIKSVPFLRFYRFQDPSLTGSALFAYSDKIQPEAAGGTGLDQSTLKVPSYWVESRNTLRLTGSFTTDQQYDAGWYEYSPAPYTDTLPWLTIAPGLLLAAVMTNMAPLLRDDRVLARWSTVFQARLAAAEEGDLIHRYDGVSDSMIPYSEDFAEDIFGVDDRF